MYEPDGNFQKRLPLHPISLHCWESSSLLSSWQPAGSWNIMKWACLKMQILFSAYERRRNVFPHHERGDATGSRRQTDVGIQQEVEDWRCVFTTKSLSSAFRSRLGLYGKWMNGGLNDASSHVCHVIDSVSLPACLSLQVFLTPAAPVSLELCNCESN